MLVLHIPDALQDAPANGIAEVLGRGLRVDIPEIDSSVHCLDTARHAIAHHVNAKARCGHVTEGREPVLLAHGLLGDE